MIATKADVISGISKQIQDLHDELDMVDLSDFEFMTDYWRIQDRIEADIENLYKEIREVLNNQDIFK